VLGATYSKPKRHAEAVKQAARCGDALRRFCEGQSLPLSPRDVAAMQAAALVAKADPALPAKVVAHMERMVAGYAIVGNKRAADAAPGNALQTKARKVK
jgi:hypothetical protein